MSNLHAQKLKARFIDTAPPGKYIDGHGLMLYVRESGTRQWVQRLVIQGVRRELGLGGYPLVTLKQARNKAFENRRIARNGGDPREHQSSAPTFAEAARTVHEIHGPAITNERYRRQWLTQLEQYAFPILGSLPVDVITMQVCYAVIEPIWLTKPKTARELRQRIEKVFDWVKVQGYRNDNPANSGLKAALPPQNVAVKNMPSMPYKDVPGAIRVIREADYPAHVRLAVEFLILTGARTEMVRNATWSEIDLTARTWTLSAKRMKARKGFRIPLSDRAIEILRATGSNRSGLVFRVGGKAMAEDKMLKALKASGFKDFTIHGFRSTVRVWCQETNKRDDVAEAMLAHGKSNAVEAAYARSDLFDERVTLMQQWADYVTA